MQTQIYTVSYEVLPGESLHDVKGHIKNLLDELKFHLEDDVRKHYEDAYEAAIGDKDALRGSDLRLGLILMTVSSQDKISVSHSNSLMATSKELKLLQWIHMHLKVSQKCYSLCIVHTVAR